MSTPTSIFAALKGLVSNRVYPDEAPQDAALPFIVYRVSAQEVIQTIDGAVLATVDTYSIDAWAETRSGAETLQNQIRAAMTSSGLEQAYLGLQWGADVEMGYEGCSLEYRIVDRP